MTERPAAELVADYHMVDVGWTVWSRAVRDWNDNGLGGVVTQWHDQKSYDDDGVITEVRYFRCLNPFMAVGHRLFVQTLTGAEISLPDGVEPPSRRRIGVLIQKLCREVSKRDHLTGTDLDHLVDAYRLAQAMDR